MPPPKFREYGLTGSQLPFSVRKGFAFSRLLKLGGLQFTIAFAANSDRSSESNSDGRGTEQTKTGQVNPDH